MQYNAIAYFPLTKNTTDIVIGALLLAIVSVFIIASGIYWSTRPIIPGPHAEEDARLERFAEEMQRSIEERKRHEAKGACDSYRERMS